jgi:CPW-WPC domain-containing protein
MQHFLCFASSALMARCAVTHDITIAPSHPILNLHLTESGGAATLNGLADSTLSSELLLGALEKRAQATEDLLGSHMSVINAQIHELVSIGSSSMQQLRGRSREHQLLGMPPDGAQREVQALKEQLDVVTRDVHASDKDVPPVDQSEGDGFDASGPEAVAREKLMNAQKNFASVGNIVESDDQKAIDSSLALAMKSPSQIGHPAPLQSANDIVRPCQLDTHACPQGWSDAGGACAASADYAGPCASELTLSGMSEEQLRAVAKYCRLELACQ